MIVRKILAVALTLGMAAPALAFDNPPPVDDVPEITTFDTASGWYIRGDLGYNASVDFDKLTVRTYKPATNTYTSQTFDNRRFSGDYSLNAGAGYQFNDWLRSDLTVDYFKGTLNGNSFSAKPCGQQRAGTHCGTGYEQDLYSLGILANGYVDLGTYWGLTPYLGAGAGVTNVDYSKLSASKYCINGSSKCDNSIDYKDARYNGLENWRFTYALTAGVSYDIAANMKLDLSYRYSDVAGGDTTDWSAGDRSHGATGVKGTDNGFSRQEIRAGLRITGW